MNCPNERSVQQEALELNARILSIAELVGERKLSNTQRSAFIRLLVRASRFSEEASETGSESSLGLAKTISRWCEISLLASEKGKGEKIDIPILRDVHISDSEDIKILNQLINKENLTFLERYRREVIIAISTAIITVIITSIFSAII